MSGGELSRQIDVVGGISSLRDDSEVWKFSSRANPVLSRFRYKFVKPRSADGLTKAAVNILTSAQSRKRLTLLDNP